MRPAALRDHPRRPRRPPAVVLPAPRWLPLRDPPAPLPPQNRAATPRICPYLISPAPPSPPRKTEPLSSPPAPPGCTSPCPAPGSSPASAVGCAHLECCVAVDVLYECSKGRVVRDAGVRRDADQRCGIVRVGGRGHHRVNTNGIVVRHRCAGRLRYGSNEGTCENVRQKFELLVKSEGIGGSRTHPAKSAGKAVLINHY